MIDTQYYCKKDIRFCDDGCKTRIEIRRKDDKVFETNCGVTQVDTTAEVYEFFSCSFEFEVDAVEKECSSIDGTGMVRFFDGTGQEAYIHYSDFSNSDNFADIDNSITTLIADCNANPSPLERSASKQEKKAVEQAEKKKEAIEVEQKKKA